MYRKLYEDGWCIIEDFFDDISTDNSNDPSYTQPLFKCSEAQQKFIAKRGISRDRIFDGVKRSTNTCGYDTLHPEETKKGNQASKAVTGPGPRQQLKPCKVTHFSNAINIAYLNRDTLHIRIR